MAAFAAANGTCVLNPAPAAHLSQRLLEQVDVLVPNRGELGTLLGHAAPTGDLRELAARAPRLGVPRLAVTLGAEGVLVIEDGHVEQVAAHAVRPVDTTGAGDTFCGALATSLAAGDDLLDAARRAAVAAALSTTRPGAQAGMPTTGEVDAAT